MVSSRSGVQLHPYSIVHERDGSSQSEAAEPSAFCVLFVLTVQQSRIYGLQL